MKQDLCEDLLRELGVSTIKHNPKRHELTHACLVSDFHTDQEKNPTASLNYDKLVYKCLGCQGSGSLLWFIAVAKGESSKSARKWLEKKSGGDGEKGLDFLLKYFDALYSQKTEKEPLPSYDTRIIDRLTLEEQHPYLEGRGIPFEHVQNYELGYDPQKDGIVIPHYWRGNLVGWQTRMLGSHWNKYDNSERFPKAETYFGKAKPGDNVIVVEAALSTVKHKEVSIPGMGDFKFISLFSAHASREQIGFLQQFNEVILWFDNDKAGWGATEKTGKALMGQPVWAIDSPVSGDPGDYSTEVAKELLNNSVVPFAVWNRPGVILCYKCYELEHQGDCNGI